MDCRRMERELRCTPAARAASAAVVSPPRLTTAQCVIVLV